MRSSDVDRTIMTAESVLAGMYPVILQQWWDSDYRWQPTSQHTVPVGEDNVSGLTSQQTFNIRVFYSYYKVGRNCIIGVKGFNNSKKATSSGARPDARDYYWFKSPMPNQLS